MFLRLMGSLQVMIYLSIGHFDFGATRWDISLRVSLCVRLFSAPADRLRIFLDNGSLCGSGSKALGGKDQDHVAHGALVVADPEGDWAGSCSFVTFQTAGITTHITTGPDGLPRLLEAQCDYPNGYRIAPQKSLQSEVLAVGSYDRTTAGRMPALPGHAALTAWADTVMAVNDLQPPRFCPSGWNSWYCYRLTITEDLVLQNARVIKERCPAWACRTCRSTTAGSTGTSWVTGCPMTASRMACRG